MTAYNNKISNQEYEKNRNQKLYDYVIVGSRRFKTEANNIGKQIMEKGYQVKLISEQTPRIETDGLNVLKKSKIKYQKQHFEAIRNCKRGVVLCNFDGYIGLNTIAELIFANAYEIPILSIEAVNSDQEELVIMDIERLNLHSL